LFFTLILFFLFLSAPCFFVVALELKSSRKMGGSACVGCKIQRDNIPENNEQINLFVVLSSLELCSQREYNLKHN